MKFSQKQIIMIVGGAVILIGLVVLVGANIRPKQNSAENVSLAVWGTDDNSTIGKIVQSYQDLRGGVKVQYRQIDPSSYESSLLDALAAGQGPDVFYIGNRELPKEKDRLAPVGQTQFDLVRLRDLFPTAVEQDFASAGDIYALPLYLDTMALFYNKDYFDQAGIVSPPKTWNDFQKDVPGLRSINASGRITRAAAAIGGSEKTVDAGVDLLNLLMLQNGAKMTSPDFSSASFASEDSGVSAFNFYLNFANAASPYYTWNDSEDNSLDSFAGQKAAVIFNYQSAEEAIKSKNPYLNFAVAPMPQPKGAAVDVNYPRYFGLAVSRQSKASAWAWDFAIYAATNADAQKAYLDASGRPPALRSLIGEKLNDPGLAVFAKQALTARSWHEANDKKIGQIFNAAIESVLNGRADSRKALNQAQGQITQLMSRYYSP